MAVNYKCASGALKRGQGYGYNYSILKKGNSKSYAKKNIFHHIIKYSLNFISYPFCARSISTKSFSRRTTTAYGSWKSWTGKQCMINSFKYVRGQ